MDKMLADHPLNARLNNFKYGFSCRLDGSLHLFRESDRRRQYFHSLGIDSADLVAADLAHGRRVAPVTREQGGGFIATTDALITATPGLFLSSTAADCFLVYLFDPQRGASGIIHAGWRGVLSKIIANTVEAMASLYALNSALLLAIISPGIRRCHFEISPSDLERYADYPESLVLRSGRIYIDLAGIIKRQLKEQGLKEENIADSGECTYCLKDKYYSFRRDKSDPLEVMAGYIGYLGR